MKPVERSLERLGVHDVAPDALEPSRAQLDRLAAIEPPADDRYADITPAGR
jgi:hypothetical protein